ncbi:MAG: DNA repair protein RecO C-terminal domain-containing protein [Planctomycetes bacterium]|nr:DNA repair protein RecO C-terminal domain-containing protein [Planctomycetota bacterium]
MATIKTEAIVLRTHRFSESSLIAVLLGKELGRLDVLVKGCRQEKNPLFGHLDLYQKEYVLVSERPQSGLAILTEAAFVDEHAGLRFSPPAFAAAGFLADFTIEAVLPGEPQPGVYAVLAAALRVLSDLGEPANRAGLAPPLPLKHVEKGIMISRTLKLALLDMFTYLGFGLELRDCTACGAAPEPGRPAGLSRRHGGLVCQICRNRATGGDWATITPAALAALRDREHSQGLELSLAPGERRRWLKFLVDYAQDILEKPLRGREILFQLLG